MDINIPIILVVLISCRVVATLHIQVNGSQLDANEQRDIEKCPLWKAASANDGVCRCSSSLKDIVICRDHPNILLLYSCYCMTYSFKSNQSLVGQCLYGCNRPGGFSFFFIPVNSTSEINDFMCGTFNRRGQLCGSCNPGHAPSVYSYNPSCVNCTNTNWTKYFAVSLLPVTVFFIFVIIFRVSATSPKLNGFILCIQIILSPHNSRVIASTSFNRNNLYFYLASLFGIWNLDFFRMVYAPFCLQPHTNSLHVISLDYLIAIYPLILVALSLGLVMLYDHNVKVIVCLWKPLLPIFIKLRREWNIRNSLLEAYATFFLLSYVKILSVSVDLLVPVWLYNEHGQTIEQLYLYNKGDIPFLGKKHLPFAILALSFFFIFTLLPMLLLFLYPCSCFQRCLNFTDYNWLSLHTFIDIFQGQYKNGTEGTLDFRYFSGIYLLLRAILYISIVATNLTASYAYTIAILVMAAVAVALTRPYKKNVYNIVDTCFFVTGALLYVTLVQLSFSHQLVIESGYMPLITVLLLILLIYIPAVCITSMASLRHFPLCFHKIKCILCTIAEYSMEQFSSTDSYQQLN